MVAGHASHSRLSEFSRYSRGRATTAPGVSCPYVSSFIWRDSWLEAPNGWFRLPCATWHTGPVPAPAGGPRRHRTATVTGTAPGTRTIQPLAGMGHPRLAATVAGIAAPSPTRSFCLRSTRRSRPLACRLVGRWSRRPRGPAFPCGPVRPAQRPGHPDQRGQLLHRRPRPGHPDPGRRSETGRPRPGPGQRTPGPGQRRRCRARPVGPRRTGPAGGGSDRTAPPARSTAAPPGTGAAVQGPTAPTRHRGADVARPLPTPVHRPRR